MSQKKLLKNSGIYSILMLFQKGINFILIPVLTIYLSTYDYGVVAIVIAINAFLNVFYLLSLPGTLNRFYYEFKDDQEKIKKLFGTIITFVLFNSFVVTGIIFLGRKWLLLPFLENVDFFPFMALGLVSVIFNPCYAIYQSSLQARQEGVRFGKNNAIFFLVNIILLLTSVILLDMGAKGVLGSLAITNIIFFIYTLSRFRKDITFGIDVDILKKSLKYAFPLIPHTLSGVTTMLIDRIIINKLLNTSLVGIYSIGNNFGSIVFLIASGINQAFVPWFNQKIKDNDQKSIPEIAKLLIVFYSVIALGLSFFSKEVIMLITPKAYHASWIVIPCISFAFVYHGVYYFFASALFYDIQGRGNRIIPVFTILAAAINIVLNITLIPRYGIFGAAVATLISKFLLSVSLSFFYNKFVQIKYPVLYMVLMPLGFYIVSLLSYMPYFDVYHFLSLKIIIFVVVLFLCFLHFKKRIKTLFKQKRIFY
ncbi:Membrane protein involved in the export of O-antigen and teichoic acid [Aquimarina amphilecti]|uniref:Membrane protein involved in the export of O-antigen and teichoic acid n=1 Tax=Aquimarina amphilecti TaxID=1038014 RepID=A0A1H7JSR8_AQUAM|nr:oligosaccharide flippase family protein [Aquimarina amphilecti]SEK77444.1 Membrane protein involved in the export of O-antigen and teichoic acid [Aquimarina amphilecti]